MGYGTTLLVGYKGRVLVGYKSRALVGCGTPLPKANMREAAKSVELLVDHPKRKEKNKKPKPPKP